MCANRRLRERVATNVIVSNFRCWTASTPNQFKPLALMVFFVYFKLSVEYLPDLR